MRKNGRYRTSELVEDSFEPGSRGRVLQNKLGITGKRAMDEVEAREQFRALSQFLEVYDRDHRFTARDICWMHEIWLGPVYEWAGSYRQVNIMKGGFPFAMARQVPALMEQLEVGPLQNHTPCLAKGHEEIICLAKGHEEIIHAVAVVHTELVLIHPFREGNGRLARMLAVLMGLQAGLPPFDFGGLKGRQRQRYFAAVQAGLDENYAPMEQVFRSVLRRTVPQG